jgi:hypothetical protein
MPISRSGPLGLRPPRSYSFYQHRGCSPRLRWGSQRSPPGSRSTARPVEPPFANRTHRREWINPSRLIVSNRRMSVLAALVTPTARGASAPRTSSHEALRSLGQIVCRPGHQSDKPAVGQGVEDSCRWRESTRSRCDERKPFGLPEEDTGLRRQWHCCRLSRERLLQAVARQGSK